jgi:hypothetical protein
MENFYTLILLAFINLSVNAQSQHTCATMENLSVQKLKDPALE